VGDMDAKPHKWRIGKDSPLVKSKTTIQSPISNGLYTLDALGSIQ
jgi:hypothetical protein